MERTERKVCIVFPVEMVEWIETEQTKAKATFGLIVRQAIYQAMTGNNNQPTPHPQPQTQPQPTEKRGPGRPPKEKAPEPEPKILPQTVEELAEELLKVVTQAGAPVKEIDLVKPFTGINSALWAGARDLLWRQKKVAMNGYPEVIWKIYVAPVAPIAPPVKKGW